MLSFSLTTFSLTSADALRVAPPTSSCATTCTKQGGEREEEGKKERREEKEERREGRQVKEEYWPTDCVLPQQPTYPHEVCFSEFKVQGLCEGDGANIASSGDGEGEGLGRVEKVLKVKGEPSIGLLQNKRE